MTISRLSNISRLTKSNSTITNVQLASAVAQPRKTNSGFRYSRRVMNGQAGRSDAESPLVVLLPWLKAQDKHVNKYVDYYLKRGYDTLVVTDVKVSTFLWPNNSFAAVDKLNEELKNTEYANRPLIIHSWSVGSYMLAVLFHRMFSHPEYADVSSRVIGCIADSVTIGSPAHMAAGIATAASKGPITKSLINTSVSTYLYLTRPWTVDIYEQLIDVFYNCPLRQTPLLYFYCHNDPMCDVSSINKLIEYQKQNGYQVFSKGWPVSQHAQHMVCHPQEYTAALTQYLRVIDPHNISLVKSAL